MSLHTFERRSGHGRRNRLRTEIIATQPCDTRKRSLTFEKGRFDGSFIRQRVEPASTPVAFPIHGTIEANDGSADFSAQFGQPLFTNSLLGDKMMVQPNDVAKRCGRWFRIFVNRHLLRIMLQIQMALNVASNSSAETRIQDGKIFACPFNSISQLPESSRKGQITTSSRTAKSLAYPSRSKFMVSIRLSPRTMFMTTRNQCHRTGGPCALLSVRRITKSRTTDLRTTVRAVTSMDMMEAR